LVLCLDAGNIKSYPGSGTTWTDVIGGDNGTLTNGPTYSNGNIVFDGIDDYVSSVSNLTLGGSFSISLWLKHSNTNVTQERYITLGSDRIIIQEDTNSNLNVYVTDGTQQNLWVWGRNNNGQLGVNNTTIRSTPVTTILGETNWKSVSCREGNTAAIKTDGTLWTWGLNSNGQLGVNNTASRLTPVTTILGGTNWKSVACGGYHIVAIKTDGTLWNWGSNLFGQLGVNDITSRSTPVTTILGGTNWKSVAGGLYHTAAIKTDGTLWNWGFNSYGQLGVNDTPTRSTPVTTILGGTNWKSVSCREGNTAAIKTDGTLWTWGRNDRGQLGVNDNIARSTPVTTILGGTNWKSVSCGGYHTSAIKTDGTLWLWGFNNNGQLGVNNTIFRSTPVTTILGGTNWKSVDCGGGNTAAIKTDGTLWTWGYNFYGSLGVNNTTYRSTPVTTILGGTNWKSVSGGSFHTSAIKTDGTFINDDSVSTTISNSAYTNIVATSNGTTLKLYQNSNLLSTTTLNGTLSSTDVSYTISDVLDGFAGNIANIVIYNKELTSSEVQQNFNALRGRFGI